MEWRQQLEAMEENGELDEFASIPPERKAVLASHYREVLSPAETEEELRIESEWIDKQTEGMTPEEAQRFIDNLFGCDDSPAPPFKEWTQAIKDYHASLPQNDLEHRYVAWHWDMMDLKKRDELAAGLFREQACRRELEKTIKVLSRDQLTSEQINQKLAIVTELNRKVDDVPLRTASMITAGARKKLRLSSAVVDGDLAASPHFRNLTWRGQAYVLLGAAAQIIEALYIAQRNWLLPGLHLQEILGEVRSYDKRKWPAGKLRVQNYFRKGDAKRLWDAGFIQHNGKGFFSLDLKIHTCTQ